jgi:hypothetical protein
MRICPNDFSIPNELIGEDVYNMFLIFENENEAIEYVVNTLNLDREKIMIELYSEDFMRKEYGKENYLRSVNINGKDMFISELMSGEYILWQGY